MHQEAQSAVERMAFQFGLHSRPGLDILDVGGRDINGSVRHLFAPDARWTVVDNVAAPEVDIVADAAAWVPDRRYDVAVCTEVFEHAEQWGSILITLAKAAPLVIVTCASTGRQVHSQVGHLELPPGEWYANVPASYLTSMMSELFGSYEVIDNQAAHDVYAWGRNN